MSQSSTKITCRKCNLEFVGVLDDLFDANEQYVGQCPSCKTLNEFNGVGAFYDSSIPENAVKVMYLRIINH